MSSDLILIYAVVAGVVLLGALAGIWWMNRDPSIPRDASGVVPLFVGGSALSEGATTDGGAASSVMATGVMAGGSVRRQTSPDMRAPSPAPAFNGATTRSAMDLNAWNAPSSAVDASRKSSPLPSGIPSAMASTFSPPASGAPTVATGPSSAAENWPPTPYRPPVIRSFTTGTPAPDAAVSPLTHQGATTRADSPLVDGSATGAPVASVAAVSADADAASVVRADMDGIFPAAAAAGINAGIPTDIRANAPLSSSAPISSAAETTIERQLLRFSPPIEGTLQFLPGRLLVVSGHDAGRELRFVRLPGPNGTEITFGRNDGELYRHIQLRDQTVSRMHAALRFADGRWHLRNLSQTNPVMLDGLAVAIGAEHALEDGARIEMGEVLFSFRNR